MGIGTVVHKNSLETNYLRIWYPNSEMANAFALAELGDSAVHRYAQNLQVELPADPINVHLFGSRLDFERAADLHTRGASRSAPGFAKGSEVFIRVLPLPRQTVAGDQGMLECVFVHELCHALYQRLFPVFRLAGMWLTEGVAEAWGERAIAGPDAYAAQRHPWYATAFHLVREALSAGALPSILELQTRRFPALPHYERFLRYSMSFLLVRMLESLHPANAARRELFGGFLKQICGLKGPPIARKARADFNALFNDPSAGPLEEGLRQYVSEEKICPWHMFGWDVRVLDEGVIAVEAADRDDAIAFHAQEVYTPQLELRANFEVCRRGICRAHLAFGRTSWNSHYCVAFGPGSISLIQYDGEFRLLERRYVSTGLSRAGVHRARIVVDGSHVEAFLDEESVFTYRKTDGPFPAGQWGVGASGGRLLFWDVAQAF
ncbi:MAG TPA: hypothetical protein VFJ58_05120 [Armatimonadota bacterium]|nr:hypothetical protein [Armatimonadota bacterium]